MGSLPYLDIAIGLSFAYLLLALACTSLNETIASVLRTRGACLDKGIGRLLGDPELKRALYKHPLINSMVENSSKICPSYIAPRKFALALMDLLTGTDAAGNNVPATDENVLMQKVMTHPNEHLRIALSAVLHDTASGQSAQQKIEAWFNDAMDRVGGWYKRTTQARILILAVIVTLMANADTVKILRNLWSNPALRAEIVQRAQSRLEKGRPDETLPMVEYPNDNDPTEVKAINLPDKDVINEDEREVLSRLGGWTGEGRQETETCWQWIFRLLWKHLLGWLITVLAISLGAPFWFDMLNRFMNIRNAGRSPDEPADKARSNQPAPAAAGVRA